MRYVELFAGAGGMSHGLEAAGMTCVAHAEIDPHAQAVLRHHWPETPLHGDVTQVDWTQYAGRVDLVSGGSPCQDLSVAGKRAGLEGARSGLFFELIRAWDETRAPYCLWENVDGARSSNKGKDFAAVLSAFVGADVAVPPDGWRKSGVAAGSTGVAAWRVLDLQHFGPPQRRRRVFVVAARAGGVDPAEVLALSEGVCGHPSPRQQARESVAANARGGIEGGVAVGWDQEINAAEELMGTLKARVLGGGHENGVLAFHHTQTPISGDVAPSVGRTTNGMGVMSFGRSSFGGWDGQDVASPVCSRDAKDATSILVMAHGQANASVDLNGCPTLTALHEAPIVVGALCAEDSVKWATDQWARQNKVVVSQTYSTPAIGNIRVDDVASTITKNTGGGGETQNPAFVVEPVFPTLAMGAHTAAPGGNGQDALQIQQTLSAVGVGRPRRLTPLECERLMSWPDQWTATGRKADGTLYALSDTARYRLCGNGVGSVCAQWIAGRLLAQEAT